MDTVNKNLVESSTVADWFSVTPRRIQQLTQEGIIDGVKIKGVYKYDLPSVTQQYIKYLSDKITGKDSKKSSQDRENLKLDAEIELKQAKAKMAALDLKELEGKMHRAEDVEAAMTDLCLVTRGMLLALPGQLAVDLARTTNASEVSAIIKNVINEILSEIARYKYSPEIYKRRLRERRQWSDYGEEQES